MRDEAPALDATSRGHDTERKDLSMQDHPNQPPSGKIPAVIYAAKSTKDRHLSIPEQLDDCREMAAENGWEVVGEFCDENFTAYTGNRGPGLARAIARAQEVAAERGCEAMLVAQHTSRFARGDGARPDAPKALVELFHEWARSHVRGRLVENDVAMSSSTAAAIQGEADHNDSKRKGKSVRKGLRRRARDRGKLSAGPRPYGYCWEDDSLVVVPREALTVRRIYEETIQGRSQMAVARSLNGDGIPAMLGGRWHQPTIRKILRNPLYIGRIVHGGEVYDGEHDAIVDKPTWEAAQRIRPTSANHGGGRHPRGSHLLTRGLLRCGRCGAAMLPRTEGRPGRAREVYRCATNTEDRGACPQMAVPREDIDGPMLAELSRRYLDVDATVQQWRERRSADAALAAGTLADAERELAQTDAALARIRQDYRDGRITASEWRDFQRELNAEQVALAAQVEQARTRTEELSDDEVEAEVLRRLADIRAALIGQLEQAPDLDSLRALLRRILKDVAYIPREHPFNSRGEPFLLPTARSEPVVFDPNDPGEPRWIEHKVPLPTYEYSFLKAK
jgi:site-specific DNA recombinase